MVYVRKIAAHPFSPSAGILLLHTSLHLLNLLHLLPRIESIEPFSRRQLTN